MQFTSTSPLKLSLYNFCRTLYTSFSVQMRAAIIYSFHTCNGHFNASNVVYWGVTQLSYQQWSRNSHHVVRMDQCHVSQVTPPYTTYDACDVTQQHHGKLLLPKVFFISNLGYSKTAKYQFMPNFHVQLRICVRSTNVHSRKMQLQGTCNCNSYCA